MPKHAPMATSAHRKLDSASSSPSGASNTPPATVAPKKSKKRIRTFTPSERAEHRLVEKQRREALNGRFLELARQVPNLANVRRLCKSLIVNESIAHHRAQRSARLLAAKEIRALMKERDELLEEVNNSRSRGKKAARQARPLDDRIQEVFKVEEEKFGVAWEGFGDGTNSKQDDDNADDGDSGLQLEWDSSNHKAEQSPLAVEIKPPPITDAPPPRLPPSLPLAPASAPPSTPTQPTRPSPIAVSHATSRPPLVSDIKPFATFEQHEIIDPSYDDSVVQWTASQPPAYTHTPEFAPQFSQQAPLQSYHLQQSPFHFEGNPVDPSHGFYPTHEMHNQQYPQYSPPFAGSPMWQFYGTQQ